MAHFAPASVNVPRSAPVGEIVSFGFPSNFVRKIVAPTFPPKEAVQELQPPMAAHPVYSISKAPVPLPPPAGCWIEEFVQFAASNAVPALFCQWRGASLFQAPCVAKADLPISGALGEIVGAAVLTGGAASAAELNAPTSSATTSDAKLNAPARPGRDLCLLSMW